LVEVRERATAAQDAAGARSVGPGLHRRGAGGEFAQRGDNFRPDLDVGIDHLVVGIGELRREDVANRGAARR